MTVKIVTASDNPFSVPPGPERRRRLHAAGMNVGLADYTDAELAAFNDEQLRAAMDEAFGRDRGPQTGPVDP